MSESNSMPPDTNMEVNDELDHNVEDEIKHDATQLEADAMNLDGGGERHGYGKLSSCIRGADTCEEGRNTTGVSGEDG
jgi:hypothetical protein